MPLIEVASVSALPVRFNDDWKSGICWRQMALLNQRTMSRTQTVFLLAVGLSFALLTGCASGTSSSGVSSGLVNTYSFSIGGRSYTVYPVSSRRNVFSVSTDDGGPGIRRQMAKVVRLAYGCHALELTETKPNWRAAEARGSVCNGGYQRFNRNR